jgi:hypothetical protein
LTVEIRDLLLPIKQYVVEQLANQVEWLAENAGDIAAFGKQVVASNATMAEILIDISLFNFSGAFDDYKKGQERIEKILKDEADRKAARDKFDNGMFEKDMRDFLEQINGLRGNARPKNDFAGAKPPSFIPKGVF